MKGYEKGGNIPTNGNNKPYPAAGGQKKGSPKLDKSKTLNLNNFVPLAKPGGKKTK